MSVKKHTDPLSLWDSKAVQYIPLRTLHFAMGIPYENSHTDKGLLYQLQIFEVVPTHATRDRRVYIGLIDMVEEQYEQDHFPACIVASSTKGVINFVRRVEHGNIPSTVLEAMTTRYVGDKAIFIDEYNHLRLPKHIVSVVLHQIDELWTTSSE